MRVWEALKEGNEKLLKAFAPVSYLWIVSYKICALAETAAGAVAVVISGGCCCASEEKETAIRIPAKRLANFLSQSTLTAKVWYHLRPAFLRLL